MYALLTKKKKNSKAFICSIKDVSFFKKKETEISMKALSKIDFHVNITHLSSSMYHVVQIYSIICSINYCCLLSVWG